MQTIIDLWNGNIAPCEHCGVHDSQVKHLVDLMKRNREILCEGLTTAQIEIFQKYIDCYEEYLFRMTELAFRDGFCMGGKLAVEMLL